MCVCVCYLIYSIDSMGLFYSLSCKFMQISFQLFIRAKDHDDWILNSDDDLDDIFINQFQEPNKGYSRPAEYYGINHRVSVHLRYRIDCQPNFYGRNCATFCVAQNDDVNGHYTCNSADGSIQCRHGYKNPSNNCRDSKLVNYNYVQAYFITACTMQ